MSGSLGENQAFASRIYIFAGAALALVAGAVWFFQSRPSSEQEIRRVLLISIDTCRADYLSCYGYGRETTPNIDAVAREATVFNRVVAPVPLTLPSHSSMLTGAIPPYHGVHHNIGYRLGKSNVTIAEILQQNGYRTGAIISSFVLNAKFGLDQGFDSYNDDFVEPIKSFPHNERRGAEASRFACEWLERHRHEPFFLFLHYYDPHHAYDPPEPFSRIFSDNLYAGEIAYSDYCIGRVIRKLKELDLYDSTLLIITSDHGESFGEHSEELHGFFIYQSTINVPLIIRVPGGPRGKRVDETVGLVDIVPTICSLVGITPSSVLRGRDLSCYIRRKGPKEKEQRYIYCESLIPTEYECGPLLGVVSGRWKYIQSPRQELYDLGKDPCENENLAEKQPKRTRLMQEHLKLILQEQVRSNESDDEFVLDEESKRRLESLGYVGGDISEDFEFDSTRDDPKDWVNVHGWLKTAMGFIRFKQYSEAEELCNKIIAEQPGYVLNSFLLGEIALGRTNISECIGHYSKFLSQIEDGNEGHYKSASFLISYVQQAYNGLGMAFAEKEDFDRAIVHYNRALQIDSDSAEIHYNLGNLFVSQKKLNDAIKYYNKALEIAPDFPDAHYNLGNALLEQEEFEEAIIHYNRAIRLKPDWREPRQNLAVAENRKRQSEETKPSWLR